MFGFYWQKSFVEAIFDVKHLSDRITLIKLVEKSIVTVLSVYVPQAGLDDSVKDLKIYNRH